VIVFAQRDYEPLVLARVNENWRREVDSLPRAQSQVIWMFTATLGDWDNAIYRIRVGLTAVVAQTLVFHQQDLTMLLGSALAFDSHEPSLHAEQRWLVEVSGVNNRFHVRLKGKKEGECYESFVVPNERCGYLSRVAKGQPA
jgi:hypothetical protein